MLPSVLLLTHRSLTQLTHHVVTTLKKCGGYVKVAVTWHSHVAMRWQLGESGIDVEEP